MWLWENMRISTGIILQGDMLKMIRLTVFVFKIEILWNNNQSIKNLISMNQVTFSSHILRILHTHFCFTLILLYFTLQIINSNQPPIKTTSHFTHTINQIPMFSKFPFLDAVKNPLEKIKATIKQAIIPERVYFTQIIPGKLYHITPLTNQNIQSFLEELTLHNHQFQIWNFSEYAYNQLLLTKLLDGRQRNSDGKQIVYNLTYQYFANIPFCQMIKSVQTIESFLSLNTQNKVYIHCQDNKRRSAVFFASYIFLTGLQTDIVTSILKVNKALNISIEDKEINQGSSPSGSIYKSQHLVLKNLMNYINNSSFINKNAWNLKKILINNAPKIHLVLKLQNFPQQTSTNIKFKVLLEIRSAQGIMYKKIFQDQFIEGESLCLRIPQNEPVLLKDDFLIIVKYVYEKKGYSILRAQLNTNFIYDPFCRVQRNDMDLSVNNAHPKHQNVFMDLLLESNSKEFSDLSQLNILKEGPQSQKNQEPEKKQVRKPSFQIRKGSSEKKQQQDEEQDGFGILDEQQEAEHNQKMQRQIEEQLARELLNIRKKRNQSDERTQNEEKNEQKEFSGKSNTEPEKASNQKENEEQKNARLVPVKNQQPKKIQDLMNFQPEVESKEGTHDAQSKEQETPQNDQEAQKSQNQESSQGESSSSEEEQSSSEQAEEQEDLDDYLSKLQNQAQKSQ